MVHHVDAEGLQLGGVAQAGQLEELGRVDGAAAQDDLTGPHRRTGPPRKEKSTPTARPPSKTTFVTKARVTTFRLGRFITGWR